MRVAAVLFAALSCLLLLHFASVKSMSDSYGQNPQHEFGAVWGPALSPLIPFWTLEGDAFANQEYVRLVPDRQSKRGGMWNTEVLHCLQFNLSLLTLSCSGQQVP